MEPVEVLISEKLFYFNVGIALYMEIKIFFLLIWGCVFLFYKGCNFNYYYFLAV